MNQTHTDLKFIRFVTAQIDQDSVTHYQRGNQQYQVLFIRIILC